MGVRFRLLASSAAAALLIACAPPAAPQASQPELAEAPLEELANVKVYSAAKRLQSVTEAPSFVTVVSGDQIRKSGYRTVAEVLQSVGGLYTDYDRNYTYVGVRGFSRPGDYNSRVLILFDGHRMNESIYDGGYVGTEFLLDLSQVERVEIARGPSAALYGENAFFAVINVVSRPIEERSGVEVSFETGSFGTYGGTIRAHGRAGATQLQASGTVYESAGPSPLYFPLFDLPSSGGGMAWDRDGDGARSVQVTLSRPGWRMQGYYVTRGKAIPTGSYGTVFNDPRNRTVDRRGFADVEYTRSVAAHWQISARGYYDHYDYRGAYIYATGASEREVERDGADGDWWGAQLSAVSDQWAKHLVTFGSEFRFNFRQQQFNHDNLYPEYEFRDAHDSANWAVYAQDEFTIAKALVLHAGVRHDRYQQFGGTTNPRLALVLRPWQATAFKLIYGTAFRAPNAWELYYSSSGYLPNPKLKPETVRTLELVAERALVKDIRLTGSLFHNRISGLIDQTEREDGLLVFQNLRRVAARGLEAQVEARRGELQLRGSYTLQQTHDAANPAGLCNAPRHQGKLHLIVPLKRGRLLATMEGQYMSRRFTSDGEQVGGFGVVNATLFAPRTIGRAEVSFSVFNLLGHRIDAAESDPFIAPVRQDERTVRLRVTYRF